MDRESKKWQQRHQVQWTFINRTSENQYKKIERWNTDLTEGSNNISLQI